MILITFLKPGSTMNTHSFAKKARRFSRDIPSSLAERSARLQWVYSTMLSAQAAAKSTQMINEDGLFALIKAAPEPNAPREPEPMDVDDDDIVVVGSESAPVDHTKALRAELNKAPANSKPAPHGKPGPSQNRPSGEI